MLLSWHLEAALQELYLKIYTYCNRLTSTFSNFSQIVDTLDVFSVYYTGFVKHEHICIIEFCVLEITGWLQVVNIQAEKYVYNPLSSMKCL